MKPILRFTAFVLLAGVLFYISCKKEYSCENCLSNPPGSTNKSPIANAGPDQTILLPLDSVSLDGSASSDPDGTISSFQWIKISGPASFNINNAAATRTVVKNLATGAYQFELKVTDNGGLSAKDTMWVIINDPAQANRPPVANAGPDQTITSPINSVNLDGSSSTDPDNNITSYAWTKISGPTSFNISNTNAVQTQVNNLVLGAYQFELKVTDAGGLFSKDTIKVTVNPVPPPPGSCTPGDRPLINAQLLPFGTLSQERYGMAEALAGNKILFAGGIMAVTNTLGGYGSTRVDIYDIVSHTWSTAELSVGRYNMTIAVSGNKVFFAGGIDVDDTGNNYVYSNVDVYDASTDSWSVMSLSVGRYSLAGATVGNKVFFAGGSILHAYPSNTVDIYDLSTNLWSTATLSEARENLSAVMAGNKIYFAGGSNGPLISNRIDIYDFTTGSWSTSTLNESKTGMASIAFAGKIYWAGGINSLTPTGNWHLSGQVEIKDINTQASSLACLFQPHAWYWKGDAAVEKNDKLVFFTSGGALTTNKFDIYDVTTNSWSIGVLPQPIGDASIISVNNSIYIAGGYVNGVLSNQVWKLEF